MSDAQDQKPSPCESCDATPAPLDRRGFIQATAVTAGTVLLADLFGDRVSAQEAKLTAQVKRYPRMKICSLKELEANEPIEFEYPEDAAHSSAMLYKLTDNDGKPRIAGGGLTDDQNIVAFSTICTHMGGDMLDGFIKRHSLIGCSEHLTTFDLTRHGIVVAGHATSALPQVLLEIEAGEIYAIGISGLLFGHHENPTG